MKPWWLVFGLLVLFVFLGGCAAGNYEGPSSQGETSSITKVPGSYYNYNPQLEDWYSPPYWMPDAD
jgi:hypothetical protein